MMFDGNPSNPKLNVALEALYAGIKAGPEEHG
jgi:hypothetical protein